MISTNWGSATDAGLVRGHNEDAFFAQFPVFVVADGMGGAAAGEVASEFTSSRFRDLAAFSDITVDDVNRALVEANQRIRDHSGTAARLDGMGTTAVGLVRVTDKHQELWLVFNIGDSRLYRMHQGSFEQVTTDHTEVQEMIELGSISPEEAKVHPLRHVITRAVGINESVEADVWLLPPVPGERFLLCSDGLTGEVPDSVIASVLLAEGDPATAAVRLVEKAVASGGHDNVTVVVVDVDSDADADLGDTSPGRDGDGAGVLIEVPFNRNVQPGSVPAVIVDVPTAVRDRHETEGLDGPSQAMINAVPTEPDDGVAGVVEPRLGVASMSEGWETRDDGGDPDD